MKERGPVTHGGITAISVAGYKSISEEQRIEIRPLTILAGANNSGKSSMMQPLRLLKQTLESPFDPGPLRLDGPNLSFTSAAEFLSRAEERRADAFQVRLEFEGQPSVTLRFKSAAEGQPTIESMRYGDATLRPGMPEKDVLAALRLVRDAEGMAHIAESFNAAAKQGGPPRWLVAPERCFLQFELRTINDQRLRISITDLAAEHVPRAIHVSGQRLRERIYNRTHVGERFPATFELYTASVIEQWQVRKDPRHEQLEKSLRELGLTARVAATPRGGGLELLVGRLPRTGKARKNDLVNIVDAGFGVSQAVPVLVALLTANPGELVYLEDPEAHLHPRAQSRLAEALAQAAKRGVRVVAETHSSLLLRGVQTLVARGKLSPELVKLHWFKRSPQGATRVHSGELDAEGAYGEKWPEDFDDVSLESEAAYLDAAERRSA